MVKHIQILGVLLIFLSVLPFSCASAAKAESSNDMASSVSRSSEVSNDDRMIAYSVSLSLFVKNPEETREMLLEQVKSNNGFIVRETENFITTRIPSENMDDFVNYAKTLGKIESESKTGTDITDQYRDNVVRLESLKSVRDRYLALLRQANNVSDMLSIEKELERLNTQIEVLEGRIKYAESSVAYSNITVRFKEKVKPGPIGWIFYGLYQGVKWLFIWNP